MQYLNEVLTNTTYKLSDFSQWSDKDIKTTSTARQMSQLPQIAVDYLKRKGKTTLEAAFRSILIQVKESRAHGTSNQCGSWISAGWRAEPVTIVAAVPATPTKEAEPAKAIFTVDNDKVEIQVKPVMVFPEEKSRKGLDYIAPIIGGLFHLVGKRVELAVVASQWSEAFKDSALKANGLEQFASVVTNVMDGCATELPDTITNALVGPKWYQFVKEQLMTMEYEKFVALTSAYHHVLKKTGKEYAYLTERIPEPANKDSPIGKIVAAAGPRGAYIVTSPLKVAHIPVLSFTEKKASKAKNASLVRALSATIGLQGLVGEANKAINVLTNTRGFTSMMSKNECEVTFLVSMTLGMLERYKKVAVEIYSTSLLDPLHNSFSKWILTKPSKERDDYSLRFVVSQSNMSVIATTYRPMCVMSIPDGYMYLWDHGATVSSKGDIKDKLKDATRLTEQIATIKNYVVRTAIYGDLFYGKATPKKADKAEEPMKSVHTVYEFGAGHGFQGIVSSQPDVAMMAKDRKGDYYLKSLKSHTTVDSWYDYVVTSCNMVIAAPFRPPIYASEICNVVTVDMTKFRVVKKLSGDFEFETLSAQTTLMGLEDDLEGEIDGDDEDENQNDEDEEDQEEDYDDEGGEEGEDDDHHEDTGNDNENDADNVPNAQPDATSDAAPEVKPEVKVKRKAASKLESNEAVKNKQMLDSLYDDV